MSKDDIIKNWKGSKKKTQNEEKPPASPVGDGELPDAELESVAGGTDDITYYVTCSIDGCSTRETYCPPPTAGACPNGTID